MEDRIFTRLQSWLTSFVKIDASLKGPKGDDGKDGKDGEDGRDGIMAETGREVCVV